MSRSSDLNAIDLEVIYQSTLQIARELTVNMLRTGYSTIIKESQDFTFAIFDGEGRMVAQGIPQPLHIGPISAQVNEIRNRLRNGNIEPNVEALICANTRTPEVTWGDINAQINTYVYGLTKFAELFGKY